MIPRIDWNRGAMHELRSPFERGQRERPLRLTLHSRSFVGLREEEQEAVDALRELPRAPEVAPLLETLEMGPGDAPHIVIDAVDEAEDLVPVRVYHRNGRVSHTGIILAHQWPRVAAWLTGHAAVEPLQPDAKVMLDDLHVALAHRAAGSDVLVTASSLLLKHRAADSVLREAGPLSPCEAAQLVGLLLRSRGVFLAGLDFRLSLSRWLFYWVLARHRFPALWRYCSTCLDAGKHRVDDTGDVAGSIITRAARAMEARDAIGEQFYGPQGHSTQERIMYHFDYLALLLSGALDAEARVAHRAYGLSEDEHFASFRRKKFVKALARAGARPLHAVVTSQRFRDTATLVYGIRNTIHGAGIRTLTAQTPPFDETFAIVPGSLALELWEAAERMGSAERWGLTRRHGEVWLEPYSYASAVVVESVRAVDDVAAATGVERLYPLGAIRPLLTDAPPDEEPFSGWIRKRLAVLG